MHGRSGCKPGGRILHPAGACPGGGAGAWSPAAASFTTTTFTPGSLVINGPEVTFVGTLVVGGSVSVNGNRGALVFDRTEAISDVLVGRDQ